MPTTKLSPSKQDAAIASLPALAAAATSARATFLAADARADMVAYGAAKRALDEAHYALARAIDAAVASKATAGRGYRAAAVQGRTFSLVATTERSGRNTRHCNYTHWHVTECDAAGATIATVTDTASSIGNAHQAIAAYLGLLPWPTAEVQVAA